MGWVDLSQWIAALAAVASVIAALVALRSSVRQLSASIAEARYAELDKFYFELLRMRIENPELAPSPFATRSKRSPCDGPMNEYACLVWCFVESVIDYCDQPGRNLSAWGPAVRHEATAYRSWLTAGNLERFRPGFSDRVSDFIARVSQTREDEGNAA
jgi:hypothetical protein